MTILLNPTKEYTVYRSSPGTNVNGVYTEPVRTIIQIKMTIQPDYGKFEQTETDFSLLQTDNDGWIKIFSKVPLLNGDPVTETKPDIVLYNSKYYEVFEAANWNDTKFRSNVRHYKSRARLKQGFMP